MRFTDSPYERMMTQKPTAGREVREPPALPADHPCHGCAYGRDTPCLGICWRELLRRK